MSVCVFVFLFVCVCVCVCDLQISTLKLPRPKLDYCAIERKRQIIAVYFENSEHILGIVLRQDNITTINSIILNNKFRPKMSSLC
jgi:hypothetical protein